MERPAIPPPAHPTYDISKVIQDALDEDAAGIGDVTTLATISEDTQATATFLAKANGTLAGLAVAQQVFQTVDPALQVQWSAADGDTVTIGTEFGSVIGSARSILVAERIALNFMQRMSGIATATAAMVAAVAGHPAKILETRKTAPGLRLFDKWAVLIGGGANHRMGLFDMIMIKDNHAAAAGGISQAIERAGAYLSSHPELGPLPVEVETRTLDEVREALSAIDCGKAPHVTRLMLDNMTPKDASLPGGVDVGLLREAVALIGGRVETEASGNVTLESVGAIASTGVSFVSCGALTHSVKALDISLNIVTGQRSEQQREQQQQQQAAQQGRQQL